MSYPQICSSIATPLPAQDQNSPLPHKPVNQQVDRNTGLLRFCCTGLRGDIRMDQWKSRCWMLLEEGVEVPESLSPSLTKKESRVPPSTEGSSLWKITFVLLFMQKELPSDSLKAAFLSAYSHIRLLGRQEEPFSGKWCFIYTLTLKKLFCLSLCFVKGCQHLQ